MTVQSTTRRAGPYLGNGVAVDFPFDFRVFQKSDVQVIRTDNNGLEEVLTLDSQYSVTINADQDANPGGTINYVGPPILPALWKLTILGAMPLSQLTDLTNVGRFNPDVIEGSLDKAVILLQQLDEKIGRAVLVPASSDSDPQDLIDALQAAALLAVQSAETATTQAGLAGGSATAASGFAATATAGAATAVAAAAAATAAVGPLTQFELRKVGANLVLLPNGGNRITINGMAETIPAGGVALAPVGVAGQLLYIYAFMSSPGVMALEGVTTGHSTDATNGIEIKTGAVSRSLVGMARVGAGPSWVDTPQQRFVATWRNRRPRALTNAVTAPTNQTNTVFAEVDNTKRVEFVTWAAAVDCRAVFTLLNTGANNCAGAIGFDGVVAEDGGGFADGGSNVSYRTITAAACKELTEGYHYATMLQRQIGGTTTWHGGAVVGERCAIVGTVDI